MTTTDERREAKLVSCGAWGRGALEHVTIAAPAAPAPGTVDIEITARDAQGPSRLGVRVTVPEPAAD